MPELPDIELYLSALRTHIGGRTVERVRLATPFLLRSVQPPLESVEGRLVTGFRRIGKRMQQAYTERVQPAMAAKREEMLRETAAIAERHPGLRACLTDRVVFLAGGSRTVPLDHLTGPLSVAQADALVAQLSGG